MGSHRQLMHITCCLVVLPALPFPPFPLVRAIVSRVVTQPGQTAESPHALTRVTSDGSFKQRPNWSPDGTSMIFARHEADTIFLYLHDLKTGSAQRLTKSTAPEYDAVYAPDGKSVLFSFDKTSPNQGDLDVYRMSLDDREPVPVAVSMGALSHEESAQWSPDGQQLVLTSTRDGNQEVYRMSVAGGEWVRLTSDPAIDAHPAWSPDGRQIAFSTNRWGDLELAVMSIDGTNLRRITTSPGLDDYPAWSPDGRRLAFTSNRNGDLDVCLYATDENRVTCIRLPDSIQNFPAWTPAGQLGFISNHEAGFEIYTTAPD